MSAYGKKGGRAGDISIVAVVVVAGRIGQGRQAKRAGRQAGRESSVSQSEQD